MPTKKTLSSKNNSSKESQSKSTIPEELNSQGIEITFMNESYDAHNSKIVIFQRNLATDYEDVIAWRVIKNCSPGMIHPFNYPMNVSISAHNSMGDFSLKKNAFEGQKWQMTHKKIGDQLVLAGSSIDPVQFEIQNFLPEGSINTEVYRDGTLLAAQNALAPMQKAIFQFKPSIIIGVTTNQIEEGDIINSALLSEFNSEFSLIGITKANIIMTGGGVGPTSKPFQFSLVLTE